MDKKENIGVVDFLKRFRTEKSATKFFIEKRWNSEITCPYCENGKIYIISGSQPFKCGECNLKFTAKTGTIMEGSHVPVRTWLLAMYLMGTARAGISSLELAKQLRVQQRTAWFMAQRIRQACESKGKLKGEVEVDETYIGGKMKNRHANKRKSGRGIANKIAVVGLKERNGRTIGKVVADTGKYELQSLIKKNVSKKALVFTDDHSSYQGLKKKGYKHFVVNHSKGEYIKGIAGTNGIESFWANFKRGLYGTHHHVSPKHLQRYVNEFCFRASNGQTMPFIEAICKEAKGGIKYKKLIRNNAKTYYTAIKSTIRRSRGSGRKIQAGIGQSIPTRAVVFAS